MSCGGSHGHLGGRGLTLSGLLFTVLPVAHPMQSAPRFLPVSHLQETFFRLAASGFVPRGLFAPVLPDAPPEPPIGRPLELEIVSHCWQYAHLLAYQLSSLVLHPPTTTSVTMTVFYSPEDKATASLLAFIQSKDVPLVHWNWQPLEKTSLFRRSLGRNRAALSTRADWIWFADCDIVFHEGAIDGAGSALLDRDDLLVFPRVHHVTELLHPDDPILEEGRGSPRLLEINAKSGFRPEERQRAVGALQIARGDVARTGGYCGTIGFYQRPVRRWRRTHDDRVFRWLLGTQGSPVEIPGLYRIRHSSKGRLKTSG